MPASREVALPDRLPWRSNMGRPVPPAAGVANPDIYNSVVSGQTLTVSDPAKGLIANDVNVYGVKVMGSVAGLTLNLDGTFTYTGAPTSFTYCGNGATTGPACATVNLNAATIENAAGITCTLPNPTRSEEHTSELQSHSDLVC